VSVEDGIVLDLVLSPFVEDSLEHALHAFTFEPRDIRYMFHQILQVLHYAHSANLVIRSLSPARYHRIAFLCALLSLSYTSVTEVE
jgi:serine/threonine protein kinase